MIGLANIDFPPGRQAVQAWRALDPLTRRVVIRRARQGLGHPDPRVAAIAVGWARAMRWWGWVAVAGMALFAGLPVGWLLSRSAADPHTGLWVCLVASILGVSGPVVVVRTQARQVQRANLPMVGRASPQ